VTVTPEQVKAARLLLGWSRSDLAGQVGVSETTVAVFEKGKRRPSPFKLSAVRAAFEASGVEFIAENGCGPGVKLRKGNPATGSLPDEELNASSDD
jgi:transcriptional regulator with XRE-family HTH domain